MESAILAGTTPTLLSNLDFRLGSVATYITERVSLSIPPANGGPFGTANQFMRFTIADGSALSFLDLSSIRLSFDLANKHAGDPLVLLGDANVLFQRARLLIKGVTVEDLIMYNRQVNMTRLMLPKRRKEDNLFESPDDAIPGNTAQHHLIPLHFGYLSQSFMHYLAAGSLIVELQLANALDVVRTPLGAAWEIQNPTVLCDVVRCRPDFCDAYSRILLSGKAITMAFSSFQTMKFEVPPAVTQFSVSISRAFTRMKAIYLTFGGTPASGANTGFADDATRDANAKEVNTFFHPARGDIADDRGPNTIEIHASLGTQTYPIIPMKGSQEMYYHLRRTLMQTTAGDTSIESRVKYLNNQFITAIQLEKAKSGGGSIASFSGESSMTGEVLRIIVKNIPAAAADRPTALFATIWHDSIINLRGDGVEVLI